MPPEETRPFGLTQRPASKPLSPALGSRGPLRPSGSRGDLRVSTAGAQPSGSSRSTPQASPGYSPPHHHGTPSSSSSPHHPGSPSALAAHHAAMMGAGYARHEYDASRRPVTAPCSPGMRASQRPGSPPLSPSRGSSPYPGALRSAGAGGSNSPPPLSQQLPPWRATCITPTPGAPSHSYAAVGCGREERPQSAYAYQESGSSQGSEQQQAREKARALHLWQQHMEERGLLDLHQRARPDDGSMIGVSVEFLVALAESLELHHALPESTEGLANELIIPTVRAQQCRLVDMVPPQYLGRPQYFISHTWAGDFTELVSTLEAELELPRAAATTPTGSGGGGGGGGGGGQSSSLQSPTSIQSPDPTRAFTPSAQQQAATAGVTPLKLPKSISVVRRDVYDNSFEATARTSSSYRPSDTGSSASTSDFTPRPSAAAPAAPSRRRNMLGASGEGPESDSEDDEDGDGGMRQVAEGAKPVQLPKGTDAYVWIDVLCCNQHPGPTGARKDVAKLRHLITDVACVLLVLTPRATAFTRSWCLYELYLTLQYRQLLKVLAPPSLTLDVFRAAVRAVDVSKAQASRVKDRAALTAEFISGGCGLPEVNRQLKEGLSRSNEEREVDTTLLRTKTAAAMFALRRLEEPVTPAAMTRARVQLHELLKYGYPRELSRLEAVMPVANAGDADFATVQRMGLLADLLEKQYKIADAKEIRRITTRLFKAYSHRFVASRYESEITQAVMAEITGRKGYRKLVARIGKNVSADVY